MRDALSLVRIADETLTAFLPINLNPGGTQGNRMSGANRDTRFALIAKLSPENRADQQF